MSAEQFTIAELNTFSPEAIRNMAPEKLSTLKLSKQDILDLDGDRMKALTATEAGRKAVQDGWNFVPPSDEELAAAAAAQKAVADKAAQDAEEARLVAEAERLAKEQIAAAELERRRTAIAAEDAELAQSGIAAERDASGNVVKLIQEYQVLDEQNRPIGRPTHLEAHSWPELARKQREAHTQAARAFNRVKEQKLTFQKKQDEQRANQDAEMAQAIQDLNNPDPAKKLAAIRKIASSDPAAEQAKKDAEAARQSYIFRARHIHDFNPCAANIQVLTDYMKANELEWTADNLDLAFDGLQGQLAPVEVPTAVSLSPNPTPTPAPVPPVTPAVSANPAPQAVVPAVPAVPAPAPTPVAQPAPAITPAPANPVPEVPRPAAYSGGLVPGETVSGARPLAKAVGLTKKDIRSWSPSQLREAMSDPETVRQMEALGIKVLKGSWEQIRDNQRR